MRVVDTDGSRGQLEEERARLQELRTTFEKEGLHRESEDESLGELSHLVQHQADVMKATTPAVPASPKPDTKSPARGGDT